MNAKTQCERILARLRAAGGDWVPLPEIVALAAQYSARILELRRAGHHIENRTKYVGGLRHSWFRLQTCARSERPATTPAPIAVCKPVDHDRQGEQSGLFSQVELERGARWEDHG